MLFTFGGVTKIFMGVILFSCGTLFLEKYYLKTKLSLLEYEIYVRHNSRGVMKVLQSMLHKHSDI